MKNGESPASAGDLKATSWINLVRRSLPLLVTFVGVCGAGVGFVAMMRFELTDGDDQPAPAHWPAASALPLATHASTLLLFAHPRCPCTRASLSELASLLSRASAPVRASVIFFEPAEDAPGEWTDAANVRQAAAIKGVTIVHDPRGREARRFHVLTSGRTLSYSSRGALQFDGGVTAARGHAGDSTGGLALLTLLSVPGGASVRTPVYGCPIFKADGEQP